MEQGLTDREAMELALELAQSRSCAPVPPLGYLLPYKSDPATVLRSTQDDGGGGCGSRDDGGGGCNAQDDGVEGSDPQDDGGERWNLSGCTLVVSLEPCPMCAGAALQTHVERVVFGAWDAKLGACGSVWDILRDPHVGHQAQVIGGVMRERSEALLLEFFDVRRQSAS